MDNFVFAFLKLQSVVPDIKSLAYIFLSIINMLPHFLLA